MLSDASLGLFDLILVLLVDYFDFCLESSASWLILSFLKRAYFSYSFWRSAFSSTVLIGYLLEDAPTVVTFVSISE